MQPYRMEDDPDDIPGLTYQQMRDLTKRERGETSRPRPAGRKVSEREIERNRARRDFMEYAPASGAAWAAMILGLFGLFSAGILSPMAWWIGAAERSAIYDGRSPRTGIGLASAGHTMGMIGTVVMGIIVAFFVLTFMAAQR